MERFAEVHGEVYDYSLVADTFKNVSTPVTIICNQHGPWEQTPSSHYNKRGCRECGFTRLSKFRSDNIETFISKAQACHGDRYDYSPTIYNGSQRNVEIICKIHGMFNQLPTHHIRGSGCPLCSTTGPSDISQEWLDRMGVALREVSLSDINIVADGYDPLSNTVYEFWGDYWHGNPKNPKTAHHKINGRMKQTFKEVFDKTQNKRKRIKDAGYTLVEVWEYDYVRGILTS